MANQSLTPQQTNRINPSHIVSVIPIVYLLTTLTVVICLKGASAVQDHSPSILLSAALVAFIVSRLFTPARQMSQIWGGIRESASQILPTLPILLCIGTLSATWMLSGVIPTMIDAGVAVMNPKWFLPITCAVCSVVSILTGSSWTTIATIGVGFLGIGSVMGYEPGWIAGAVISGAYFGDKVSPLSDTTVLASASCNVPLTTHIRNLMWTSLPALILAVIIFSCVGFMTSTHSSAQSLCHGRRPAEYVQYLTLALCHTGLDRPAHPPQMSDSYHPYSRVARRVGCHVCISATDYLPD